MDGFTFVNLFDTKGIEYIIIIAFLLLIIPFWVLLNRPVNVKSGSSVQTLPLSSVLSAVPQGILFSKNHTWAHLLRSGEARIGICSLLTNLTGSVNLKMLKEPGSRVARGEILAEISQNGKRMTIVSPVSGTVTGLNPSLGDDPSLLHEDPYGKGWVCSIRPADWIAETGGFRVADGATAWFRMELERIRDFMANTARKSVNDSSAVYLQDGGEPAGQLLASMPPEVWHAFQKEFLE